MYRFIVFDPCNTNAQDEPWATLGIKVTIPRLADIISCLRD